MPPQPKSLLPPSTRTCLRGNHTVDVKLFFPNKLYTDASCRDTWCKHCVANIATKLEMQRYFFENHRVWSDSLWDASIEKARALLAQQATYQKASPDRRATLEERFAVPEVVKLMNHPAHYKYFDPMGRTFEDYYSSKPHPKLAPAASPSSSSSSAASRSPSERRYSEEFNGSFNSDELAYLHKFYDNMGGNELEDAFVQDNLRILAVLSLAVHKAQDDYNNGRTELDTVTSSVAAYQNLAKTMNITAVQKKARETSNTETTWSQWAKKLLEKEIYTPKITWPEDDIDRTLREYQHIIHAVKGGDDSA